MSEEETYNRTNRDLAELSKASDLLKRRLDSAMENFSLFRSEELLTDDLNEALFLVSSIVNDIDNINIMHNLVKKPLILEQFYH